MIEICIQNIEKYVDIQFPIDESFKKYTVFNSLVRIGIVQLLNNIEYGSQYFHQ